MAAILLPSIWSSVSRYLAAANTSGARMRPVSAALPPQRRLSPRPPKLSSTKAAYPSCWSHTAHSLIWGPMPPQPWSRMTAGKGPAPLGVESWAVSVAGAGELTAMACESAHAVETNRTARMVAQAVRVGATGAAGPATAAGAGFDSHSGDYLFDGVRGSVAEDDAPRPLAVYGRRKRPAEHAVMVACRRAVIIRTSVVYGPARQEKNF